MCQAQVLQHRSAGLGLLVARKKGRGRCGEGRRQREEGEGKDVGRRNILHAVATCSHYNLERAGLTLKSEHGYSQLAILQLKDIRCRHCDLLDIRSE